MSLLSYGMRNQQIIKADNISRRSVPLILLGIRISNLWQNGLSKVPIQTPWKLQEKILIDQVKIIKKILRVKHFNSYVA